MSANFMKYTSLAIVIPHSITYTILGALSRRPDANGNVFYGPSAVFLMECGKLIISLIGVALTMKAVELANGSKRPLKRTASNAGEEDPDMLVGLLSSTATSGQSSPNLAAQKGEDVARFEHYVDMNLEKDNKHHTTELQQGLSAFQRLKKEVITPNAFRLCIPALLYALQNNLQIFAAGFLTPAEYQVLTQLKLVATAIFSVTILRKRLNAQRWASIVFLIVGVSIVQCLSARQTRQAQTAAEISSISEATHESLPSPSQVRTHFDLMIGTALMIGASACSGLAGVLIEALLKGANNIWTTNVHLAFFSLLSASVPVLADIVINRRIDPFRYYNIYVYSLIVLNMAGGVMMAMVLKYADNILKNFAVALSLVGTVLLSSLVSSIPLHAFQVIGTAVVVCSTVAYGLA
jgi:UDP-sugar transporter A1/2/3